MRMTNDALVLAGGGVAGISWEVGVLFGIQEADPGLVASILAARASRGHRCAIARADLAAEPSAHHGS
jgi:hypothetical protein